MTLGQQFALVVASPLRVPLQTSGVSAHCSRDCPQPGLQHTPLPSVPPYGAQIGAGGVGGGEGAWQNVHALHLHLQQGGRGVTAVSTYATPTLKFESRAAHMAQFIGMGLQNSAHISKAESRTSEPFLNVSGAEHGTGAGGERPALGAGLGARSRLGPGKRLPSSTQGASCPGAHF